MIARSKRPKQSLLTVQCEGQADAQGGTAKRMRILHVVGGLHLGGGEKLTVLVAAALDRDQFHVHVVNLGLPGPYGDYLRSHGVSVTDIGIPLRPRLRDVPTALHGLVRLLRILWQRDRWDVVHTHMFRTSLICAIPARLAGSRLFGTVHRVYYKWQPFVERALSPLHEAIVTDSTAVRNILQNLTHIRQDRYVVIHNGIDTREFSEPPSKTEARTALGLPHDSLVITEVAHLVSHKGQGHLIAAFARLRNARNRLLLVGDGQMRGSLEDQARSLGLADCVVFAGVRKDLVHVLAATDILALPSTFEGFGIIHAEAMYMRLPVVGTNLGGATEVVLDGITGYLVPFGDEAALTDRLQRLQDSEDLRRQFGEAGRARVLECFTQDAMSKKYAELYQRRIKKGT